jgi:hypothetical protein
MSFTINPGFNPSPQATQAFRHTFNDWQVTPLQSLDGGGDVHATWQRGSDQFHITTQLPGGAHVHDWFNVG